MCGGMLANNSSTNTTNTTNTQGTSNTALALTALGGLISSGSEQDAYNAKISAANTNAALARQQSYNTGYAGQQQANDLRNQGLQTVGAQRAAYGASGLDVNRGTAANTQAATMGQAETAAQRVSYNTMLQQWGYDKEAQQYESQAAALAKQKKSAGVASLITTGTNLAKMYQGYWGTKNV